ncbi:hypothetical protein CC_2507 [Caulobacter vibrioides CB15]|uniref:Uncharacterized protein n=1 Tax=Caulobacter vibrioides (strain ATCC 19089 / CIP 103742 / CB 15) TaxID=190650 RepID=Q9A5E3_CAUVC|nr:hypothetical protein CC_2507 [Caulobacter vibrioides CB15]ATC29359.1 hypothetical protein CA607_13585 [Caulobacter vibrioides]
MGSRSSNISNRPTSPANAGAQIHPERFGLTRHRDQPRSFTLVGSIWIPAFAGKVGFLEGLEAVTDPSGTPGAVRPSRRAQERAPQDEVFSKAVLILRCEPQASLEGRTEPPSGSASEPLRAFRFVARWGWPRRSDPAPKDQGPRS